MIWSRQQLDGQSDCLHNLAAGLKLFWLRNSPFSRKCVWTGSVLDSQELFGLWNFVQLISTDANLCGGLISLPWPRPRLSPTPTYCRSWCCRWLPNPFPRQPRAASDCGAASAAETGNTVTASQKDAAVPRRHNATDGTIVWTAAGDAATFHKMLQRTFNRRFHVFTEHLFMVPFDKVIDR